MHLQQAIITTSINLKKHQFREALNHFILVKICTQMKKNFMM